MITIEDINRCKDEKQNLKLVVVETTQFFEFEIPANQDPEEFVNSTDCLLKCAAQILNQTVELTVDRVCTEYDETNEMWIDP